MEGAVVLSVGAFPRDPSPYFRQFWRKPRTARPSIATELNPAPQFKEHYLFATGGVFYIEESSIAMHGRHNIYMTDI